MRPSEFEAIRPHLEEALDHLDRYLNRQREIEEEAPKLWEAAMAGKLPKAKLRTLTEEEQQEAVRIFRSQPPARIEHAYPWSHSAARAAVDLRDCGWTKEAEAIGEVLSELPTGLLDGSHPENMDRQFDAIREGAERLKTILTTCLAGGPSPQGGKSDDAGAAHPRADQNGTGNDQSQSGSAKLSPRELASKHGVEAGTLRKRLDRWRYEHDAGYVEVSNPVRNKPKYLYDESAVMSVIEALKAKPAGRKRAANGQRKKR